MSRRLIQAAVALVVLVVAAQFVRPERASPPTDASRTIQAALGPASPLPAILDRSCGDCHSNNSVSSWYAQVAPLSWLVARGVTEGRRAVNFSEWAGYSPEVQHALLSASCDDATRGKMPGLYTLLRSEARLSSRDIETICAAAK